MFGFLPRRLPSHTEPAVFAPVPTSPPSISRHPQVGIVGRTGCGKSTLVLALYRLVEPCGGRVLLDGIDTARIGLRDLRSRLTLVPQVRLGSGP